MKNLIENIHLDFRSGVPIYTQIVEQVKQQVISGELKPEDQLPTVRALALELRVNFNTVARAYRWLEEAGLLSMCQGRGTFVLERPLAALEREQMHQQESLAHFARRTLSDARQMGYTPEELMAALMDVSKDTTQKAG